MKKTDQEYEHLRQYEMDKLLGLLQHYRGSISFEEDEELMSRPVQMIVASEDIDFRWRVMLGYYDTFSADMIRDITNAITAQDGYAKARRLGRYKVIE